MEQPGRGLLEDLPDVDDRARGARDLQHQSGRGEQEHQAEQRGLHAVQSWQDRDDQQHAREERQGHRHRQCRASVHLAGLRAQVLRDECQRGRQGDRPPVRRADPPGRDGGEYRRDADSHGAEVVPMRDGRIRARRGDQASGQDDRVRRHTLAASLHPGSVPQAGARA